MRSRRVPLRLAGVHWRHSGVGPTHGRHLIPWSPRSRHAGMHLSCLMGTQDHFRVLEHSWPLTTSHDSREGSIMKSFYAVSLEIMRSLTLFRPCSHDPDGEVFEFTRRLCPVPRTCCRQYLTSCMTDREFVSNKRCDSRCEVTRGARHLQLTAC